MGGERAHADVQTFERRVGGRGRQGGAQRPPTHHRSRPWLRPRRARRGEGGVRVLARLRVCGRRGCLLLPLFHARPAPLLDSLLGVMQYSGWDAMNSTASHTVTRRGGQRLVLQRQPSNKGNETHTDAKRLASHKPHYKPASLSCSCQFLHSLSYARATRPHGMPPIAAARPTTMLRCLARLSATHARLGSLKKADRLLVVFTCAHCRSEVEARSAGVGDRLMKRTSLSEPSFKGAGLG